MMEAIVCGFSLGYLLVSRAHPIATKFLLVCFYKFSLSDSHLMRTVTTTLLRLGL